MTADTITSFRMNRLAGVTSKLVTTAVLRRLLISFQTKKMMAKHADDEGDQVHSRQECPCGGCRG